MGETTNKIVTKLSGFAHSVLLQVYDYILWILNRIVGILLTLTCVLH